MTTNEYRVIEKPRNKFVETCSISERTHTHTHTKNMKQHIVCVCAVQGQNNGSKLQHNFLLIKQISLFYKSSMIDILQAVCLLTELFCSMEPLLSSCVVLSVCDVHQAQQCMYSLFFIHISEKVSSVML
jgi:hypothetical protein